MQKNILITGAAGFLGKSLSINLLKLNPERLLLLDRNVNELEKLKTDLDKINTSTIIKFIVCDIKNVISLEKTFDKYRPQYIYHLAAYTNINSYLKFPKEVIDNNFNLNIAISELSIKYEIEKFIYISNKLNQKEVFFFDLINRISELYLLSKFESNKEKIKFVSIRLGKILEHEEFADVKNLRFLDFYKDHHNIIETDCKLEIIDHIIDASIFIDNSNILHYNSSIIQGNNTIKNSEISKNSILSNLFSEDQDLVKTTHNKILIARSRIHKKINLDQIIEKSLLINSSVNFSTENYLNEIKIILNEELVERQKLKIID